MKHDIQQQKSMSLVTNMVIQISKGWDNDELYLCGSSVI